MRALGILAIVAAAPLARAQPSPGTARFEEGRELAREGKYAEACAKFAESVVLEPAAGTELNLGDCHEHQGHAAAAWHYYDRAATEFARTNDKRASFARGRADALVSQLATVVVQIADATTPGLEVTIAGRSITPAANVVTKRVDPGEVVVRATAPGKPPLTRTTRAVAGATVTVDIPSFDAPVPTSLDKRVDHTAAVPRDPGRLRIAYGVGVGGGGLVATGVVLGLVARGNYQHQFDASNCSKIGGQSVCNGTGLTSQRSAITLGNVGTVVGVIGVAAIGAAAIVFVTAPRDVAIVPTASEHGGGVAVSGRF
jgi:hypothetical protein